MVFDGLREVPVSPTAVISGELDLRTKTTGYNLELKLTRIDLAGLFNFDGPPSKVSGTIDYCQQF